MIEAYYNLKRRPFPKDIPAKDIFLSDSMKELNKRLEYMKQNRGIFLITGEAGVGKTLAIRAFVEGLNPNIFISFYIPLSTVSVIEFYRQISISLGGDDYWQKSKLFLSIQDTIKDYVSNSAGPGKRGAAGEIPDVLRYGRRLIPTASLETVRWEAGKKGESNPDWHLSG